MIKVLFVCLGNICRSPMAEAIFKDLVKQDGLENHFQVDSAGIGHWHSGEPPHKGTRDRLDKASISYEGMLARQIRRQDWEDYDYIIAMDKQNINDLSNFQSENGNVRLARLRDFVNGSTVMDIPDPYFTNNFDYVFELVHEGCKELFKQVKNSHKLYLRSEQNG